MAELKTKPHDGDVDAYDTLLGRLGKHSTGKSCLYVKRLGDVDHDCSAS